MAEGGANVFHVPKGSLDVQARGTWWRGTWGDGEGQTVELKCPNGHIATLWSRREGVDESRHHRIVGDGFVQRYVTPIQKGTSPPPFKVA